MYFLLTLLAAAGYALQGTLMASVYRRLDRLSAVALRGLSLGISMLPLLLFVPAADLLRAPDYLPYIIAASILAALGNWCSANAVNHLPVGISSALCMSFASVIAVTIGYFFLGESLGSLQLVFIALILVVIICLGASRTRGVLPPAYHAGRGILYSCLFGLFLGAGYTLIGVVSRSLHPFLAGYLWEFAIGLVALAFVLLRSLRSASRVPSVSRKDFLRILLFSSPTIAGTGLYALAMSMGPVGIVTAIISTMMVFSTLLAWPIYGEKLSAGQWVLFLAACAMVFGLKLAS